MKTRNKWIRILTFVFVILMSSTVYVCARGNYDAGIGVTYGKMAANAERYPSYQKETFSMDRLGVLMSARNVPLEIRLGWLFQSDITGFNLGLAFSYPIPIIPNRLFIYPGVELGGNLMSQHLRKPYMGESSADALSGYGRGFIGIGLYLSEKTTLAVEGGWSKYNAFNEWAIVDPSTKDRPASERSVLLVPDELLNYSQMEAGGYEFAIFLRYYFPI